MSELPRMNTGAVLITVVLLLTPLVTLSQTATTTPGQTVYRVTPSDALSRLIVTDAIAGWRPVSQPTMAAFEVFADASGKVTEARSFATTSDADLSVAQAIVKNLAFHPILYQGSAVSFVSVLALCSDSEIGTVPCAPKLNDHHGVSDPVPERLRLPLCDNSQTRDKCSNAVLTAHKISGKTPIYPDQAKHARIMGNVMVHILISRTGDVVGTQVIGGPPMLYASAVSALKSWKYKPFLWNGNAVEVDCIALIRYELRG